MRYIPVKSCRECPNYGRRDEKDPDSYQCKLERVNICECCSYSIPSFCPLSKTPDGRPEPLRPTPTPVYARPPDARIVGK